jgi:hypothetical protein
MSIWYIVKDKNLPSSKQILVEDRNDVVYERFIIDRQGNSWKVSAKSIFHAGYTSSRFSTYIKRSDVEVTEVTEQEAFTIML